MANTFKLKTKANIGVTTVGIYTVPASTTTVVIGITLANTAGSGVNVGVGVTSGFSIPSFSGSNLNKQSLATPASRDR